MVTSYFPKSRILNFYPFSSNSIFECIDGAILFFLEVEIDSWSLSSNCLSKLCLTDLILSEHIHSNLRGLVAQVQEGGGEN